jgi:very-short-patch-repair endonuclease
MDRPTEWRQRFLDSLGQFEIAHGPPFPADFFGPLFSLTGSLEDHVRSTDQWCKPQHDLRMEVVRAKAHKYIARTFWLQQRLLEMCESPIEEAMASALWVAADYFPGGPVELDLGYAPSTADCETVIIRPQAQIGDYRVDFLLRYKTALPKFEDGIFVRDVESEKQMIVECDGHDFHERTKEQASSDRKRDRSLQAAGFLVFRFSGADIWRDVFGCATQALAALMQAANAEADRLSRA